MSIPLRQKLAVGAYIAGKRLQGIEKYPLVLQLEPLFMCNLECAGCGKIQHTDDILARRLSVAESVAAVEECGAPIVSIAGGEPLIHREIHEIARALIERKKFVYLCTNAIMMRKKLDLFQPSPYFAWSVHIDGLRERHDQSVCRPGIFEKAVGCGARGQATRFPGDDELDVFRPRRCHLDPARCSTSSTTTCRSTRCRSLRASPTRRRPTRSIS